MPKRIILLLDGTWNDAESGDNDTNIVRLEDGIVRYLRRRQEKGNARTEAGQPGSETNQQDNAKVHAYETDGLENFVYYQRGVGTGFKNSLRDGAFGSGLSDNIRRAYIFLSHHFEMGDQIFVFGFSRGAFTARSVIGYVQSAGLLRRWHCTAENEWAAWSYYRTAPSDRMPGEWSALTPLMHDRRDLRISCVGVFDTVGALGVPLELFQRKNRQAFSFHDVTLSSIVDVNLHAMAIDELRQPFGATLWRRPRFKEYNTATEQVWFAGVHADVGGGYISAYARKAEKHASLDDITLDWMVKRLKSYFPHFPIELDEAFCPNGRTSAGQHNSRRSYYKVLRLAYRTLCNMPMPESELRFWQTLASYDRRDEQIGEAVHISALERLGRQVQMGGKTKSYAPPNLLRILPAIESTYAGTSRGPKVNVVDWDGTVIDAGDPWCGSKVLLLIDEARLRLAETRRRWKIFLV